VFDYVKYFYVRGNSLNGNVPDLSNADRLIRINLSYNDLDGFAGGTISITGGQLYITDNKLPQGAIDAILKALVDGDTTNTYVRLEGGDNEEPSDDGKANIDTLRDNGCTVTVTGGY
jgi:hypothetical protein